MRRKELCAIFFMRQSLYSSLFNETLLNPGLSQIGALINHVGLVAVHRLMEEQARRSNDDCSEDPLVPFVAGVHCCPGTCVEGSDCVYRSNTDKALVVSQHSLQIWSHVVIDFDSRESCVFALTSTTLCIATVPFGPFSPPSSTLSLR